MASTELAVRSSISSIGEIQQVKSLLAMSNYFDAKGNERTGHCTVGDENSGRAGDGLRPVRIRPGNPRHPGQTHHECQPHGWRSQELRHAMTIVLRQMEDTAVSVEFFERIGGKLENLGVSTFTLGMRKGRYAELAEVCP